MSIDYSFVFIFENDKFRILSLLNLHSKEIKPFFFSSLSKMVEREKKEGDFFRLLVPVPQFFRRFFPLVYFSSNI